MSRQGQPIAPINHTAGSAMGRTVTGAAGGAVKGGVKTWLGWMGLSIAVGAAIGVTVMTGGGGAIFSAGVLKVVAGLVGGGLVGGFLGGAIATPVAGVGAAVGGISGGARSADRVGQERVAAAQVEAQIEAIRAANGQASQTFINAPSANNHNSFPQQGSRMNPAAARVQAAGHQDYANEASRAAAQGTIDAQQRAAGLA